MVKNQGATNNPQLRHTGTYTEPDSEKETSVALAQVEVMVRVFDVLLEEEVLSA